MLKGTLYIENQRYNVPFYKAHHQCISTTGRSIKTAEEGGSDKEIKVDAKRLLKVSDSTGSIKMTLVASGM